MGPSSQFTIISFGLGAVSYGMVSRLFLKDGAMVWCVETGVCSLWREIGRQESHRTKTIKNSLVLSTEQRGQKSSL